MIRFRYEYQPSLHWGQILRPIATVGLEVNHRKIETPMYIDSGADITMVPLNLGRALGFKQTPSDKIYEIRGVSGGGVAYILKTAYLTIGKHRFKIRLAWALIEEVPILLGRMDIFPRFKIAFDERKEVVSFAPHHSIK